MGFSISNLLRTATFMALTCCALTVRGQRASTDIARDSILATTRVFDLEGHNTIKGCATPQAASANPALDSIARRARMFYFDQFRHSQDPEAPTFLFLSKSADLLMGIGGVVRMRGWYEWGGVVPSPGFLPCL